MFIKKSKHTSNIILIGLIIRLIIAPFTLNWDLLVNTQTVVNFYQQTLTQFYQAPLAAYPPLMYWLLNILLVPVKLFAGQDFINWIKMENILTLFYPSVFRIVFLLKLPAIIFEIMTAYFFSKLFSKKNQSFVLSLWLFNPLSLYLVAMWSNVDIFPVFFIILNFYFFKKNQIFLAALSLGLAVSLKIFAVFIIPFFIFTQPGWKKRIIYIISMGLPIILSHIPVMGIPVYFQHAVAGGYSQRILFTILNIGPERALVYFYVIYFVYFFYYLSQKNKSNLYIYAALFCLLPVFILSLFSLQWFLWIFPLIIFYHLNFKKIIIPLVFIYICYFGMALFSQLQMNFGMFGLIAPMLWFYDWPAKELFGSDPTLSILNNLHSVLAASLIWMTYQFHKNDNLSL